jgi:ubiquinone/menaquinone biosynthesis C-methylase UbiE
MAEKHDKEGLMLDIAPQDHEGAKKYFKKINIETLDIDSNSKATYIADLCKNNKELISNDKFDFILCSEVLEHTLQPFNAVNELYRILKPGGHLFLTVPFNFRIHGPLPDCWRFTEHGLKELLKSFNIIELNQLGDKNRFLMPIAYTVIAKK